MSCNPPFPPSCDRLLCAAPSAYVVFLLLSWLWALNPLGMAFRLVVTVL